MSSCSTQKNTPSSRWWHSFNARYNTYYNASLAYIDASLEKENGNKDNFTETLPLYAVSYKQSREIGKGNYETAITKSKKAIRRHSIKKRPVWTKKRKKTERDIEWLNRKEYNPFLWKAWMLMGRAQFHSGAFDEAAATFSYMSRLYKTQPAIYGKARAWLAKCYIEQDWMYDAEDVIRNMRRDSIDWRARKEWDYTLADYYLHTGQADSAALYMRRVVKHEMRKKQRAREWYILGQIYTLSGKYPEAYDAYRHVIRQNPPYELEFNARISMTEVMPGLKAKNKIGRLKRMARSDKNKDYLDQVYYALGNIYMAEHDTANAINSYEKGLKLATRSGIEKGVLSCTLANLYWDMERFSDARRCYTEAIGLLDGEREGYDALALRSKTLDELCPHTEAIHLQDSLQSLAKMSEKERNEAIDRVIEALKKKEREERAAQLDAASGMAGNTGGQTAATQNTPAGGTQTQAQPGQKTSVWYFYNPMAVQQGKQAFQRQWGKRPEEDNWRRINKTVVSAIAGNGVAENTDEAISETDDAGDSAVETSDSVNNDPHKREYYLAQIPFTEEQVTASNLLLSEALFNAGVILKDKMDNLTLSERHLLRLADNFPSYEKMPDAHYHLFLLYSRRGDTARASRYKQKLAENYPSSEWTKLICDPHYVENALYGPHIEDSLYAQTYEAFRNDDTEVVSRNAHISQTRYPDGANRPKFIFLSGMTRLSMNDVDSCIHAMENIVGDYPESEVAPIAGMIINGVKAGRTLHARHYDVGGIWERRAATDDGGSDSTSYRFSPNTDEEFCFLMTYSPDSLAQAGGENRLLYDISRHNFTSYLVRNFDIELEPYGQMHRLQIRGFRNIDEARAYARSLYATKPLLPLLERSHNIIISLSNLALLGQQLSYNDYDRFYQDSIGENNLIGSYILNEQLLPEDDDTDIAPSLSPSATPDGTGRQPIADGQADRQATDSGMEIYDDNSPAESRPTRNTTDDDNNTIIIDTTASDELESKRDMGGSDNVMTADSLTAGGRLPAAEGVASSQRDRQHGYQDAETNPPPSTSQKDAGSSTGGTASQRQITAKPRQTADTSANNKSEGISKPKQTQRTTDSLRQELNANVIEIIDDSTPTPKAKKTAPEPKKKKKDKAEDEYFELEGF
ncbi:MAG: tetratricopeptide repeat protein [Prevotella sp.]